MAKNNEDFLILGFVGAVLIGFLYLINKYVTKKNVDPVTGSLTSSVEVPTPTLAGIPTLVAPVTTDGTASDWMGIDYSGNPSIEALGGVSGSW